MRSTNAVVVDLSRYTRAVITYTSSGLLGPITLLRGHEAFTLSDREARNLLETPSHPPEPSEDIPQWHG